VQEIERVTVREALIEKSNLGKPPAELAHATIPSVTGASRGGVADYLIKPTDVRHLRSILAA
jgi:DNA-binding NtrC family response regulator